MSVLEDGAYANDGRVRVEPVSGTCWVVATRLFGDVAVARGDDDVFRAFEYERGYNPPSESWLTEGPFYRLGDRLERASEGSFDTVVQALIGDPQ